MIVQQNKNEAIYLGEVQQNTVGIDTKNINFITQLLTSNLYSNPFSSFLRETISNAYDSHVEANSDEYILLLIERLDKYSGYYSYLSKIKCRVSIRDYGTGLSPERFNEIYRNIGSSTKRDSNDYIGMMGIGRMSCLSCADIANITSYYNGIKYSYLMYKNDGGINIDKVGEEQGDFKNGLEVSIETSVSERDLMDALVDVSFFDKLHLKIVDWNTISLEVQNPFNSRRIINCKYFCYNTYLKNCYTSLSPKVKMGNVLYPLDSPYKNTSPYSYTNALVIDIPMGELDITPSREALQYTTKTNEALDKYGKLAKDSLDKFVCDYLSKDWNIKDFIEVMGEGDYRNFGGIKVSLGKLDSIYLLIKNVIDGVKQANVYVEGKPVSSPIILKWDDIMDKEINPKFIYDCYRDSGHTKIVTFRQFTKGSIFIKRDKRLKAAYKKWLYSTEKSFLILHPEIEEFIKNYPLENEFFSLFPVKSLSNEDIPQQYIENTEKSSKTASDDIGVRVYTSADHYSRNCLKSLKCHKGTIIYSENDRNTSLIGTIGCIPNLHGITVSKSNIPILEKDNRCIRLEKVLTERHPAIAKAVTACIILNNFYKLNERLNSYKPGLDLLNINSFRLPLYKEFRMKYRAYEDSIKTYDPLYELYYKNGWYNKAEVKYYYITDKELAILAKSMDLDTKYNAIKESIRYLLCGKSNRLGISLPERFINIKKYMKNDNLKTEQ